MGVEEGGRVGQRATARGVVALREGGGAGGEVNQQIYDLLKVEEVVVFIGPYPY
jgi:hypothetical protein